MAPPELVDVPELHALTAPGRDDELGAAAGRPLVLVHLDDDDPAALGGWTPGARPVVVVGVTPATAPTPPPADHPCDIVIGRDDPLLPAVIEAVTRHPLAATAGAILLRHALTRDVEHGLAAESATYSMLQTGPEFTSWRHARSPSTIPPEPDAIVVTRDADTLTITLNRPARHNALDRNLRDRLAEALTLAALDDSVTNVVLRGNGPSFCSGGDLDEFGSFPDPATAHASRLTRSPARLAHRLRSRLHVHLHGACMGAGIEIPAFACDITATSDTRIALPELAAGLVPGAGGTVSIPRRIGRHRTTLLALSGTRLDAHAAHTWGLIDHVTNEQKPAS